LAPFVPSAEADFLRPHCSIQNIGLVGVSKLLINFLYHYEVAFVPRSASSPHKLAGRGLGGNTEDEPWNVVSTFAVMRNLWRLSSL
jgi:hypothetical protein